jgi:hypothetical protein
MSRLLLLAGLLVGLGGCTELGYAQDVFGGRYPERGRYPDRTSGRDDYSRTPEYRRITSDAADYARRVDDALRVGNDQERRIRDLLTDRTARLLQRARARDHREVYPFPRRFRGETRATREFWAQADRDIERILDRRDAQAYRRFVRAGGQVDRRGRSDDRYDRRDRDDGERGGIWGVRSWGRDDD